MTYFDTDTREVPPYPDSGDPYRSESGGGSGNEPPYDDLDDEFAPQPRGRLGRFTIALAVVLILGVGVLGGVAIQKHYGSTSSTAATRGGAFTGAAGRGEGATGFGGAGGAGGFGPNAAGTGSTTTGGSTTGSSTTGSGSTTSSVPAVIGQVVSISGQTLIVKNLGGTQVTVHLTSTTTVTTNYPAKALAAGTTVSVFGTTAADKSVTATGITVRS